MNVISDLEHFAVESAGKLLLDHQLWADVKVFVEDIENADHLTNEQKHAKVKNDLHIVFGDITNCVVHLAISLAVAWIKTRKLLE